jgi:hypothetical protein
MADLIDRVTKLAADCELAAKVMAETGTFETGQAILKEAAAALTALSEQVAELTRERDDLQAVLTTREASAAVRTVGRALRSMTAAEAKLARLERALRKIGTLAPVEKPPEPYDKNGWQTADTGERHAERVLAKDMWLVADFARAALTEGDTNG